MPRYLTGLITTDYWHFPKFPYSADQWSLHLARTAKSKRCVESIAGPRERNRLVVGREVVIEAKHALSARRAAFTIQAAAQVLDGSAFLSWWGGAVIELQEIGGRRREDAEHETNSDKGAMCSRPNIPIECMVAVKAVRRRNWVYALSKLWLSYQIHSVAGIDLDPAHSETIPKSTHPIDHVSCATAIVLAYSTIEELGLEVRANMKQPSKINGAWNPAVKQELEGRLKAAGVDPREPYNWNVRGPRTRLEREHPPIALKRSPWARWDVRDKEVEIVDAIAHASWLRSRVSAHRLKYELARVLSVYDVANVQYLARRLMLESISLRRIWPKYYENPSLYD